MKHIKNLMTVSGLALVMGSSILISGQSVNAVNIPIPNVSVPGLGEGSNSVENLVVLPPTKNVTNLKVTNIQTDAIALSWEPAADADWYVISYWPTGSAQTPVVLNNVGNVTSYVLGGLEQKEYVIYVMPAKRRDNGELVYSSKLNYTQIHCAPLPVKPGDFSLSRIGNGYCSFTVSGLGATDTSFYNTELVLYDYRGKVINTYSGEPTHVSVNSSKVKKNHFYSAKVRGYYVLPDGSKRYGDWSKKITFASSIGTVSGTASDGKIRMKWSGVKGASNYSVYVKTAGASGYQKVSTVKKNQYTVKQYRKKALKNNQTYYLKVVANKKQNGHLYKCKSAVYKVRMYSN